MLLLAGLASASWAERSYADQDSAAPLKQMSLAELGNVEVTTASKEPEEVWKTPAAIYVITQEDIRRSGATNLPDVLRLAPGVEVAQIDSDHWSVSIRGFGAELANKLLVLIDGRSVYAPLYAGVYWQAQATPLLDIERIEVIRGPGGTIWGANAVDGVINIITKSSTDTHGALLTAGGGNVDQGTGDARYGAQNSHGFNYRAYVMGFTNGPEFHSDGPNFDDWRMGQAGFRADWAKAHRDSFTLQGDIYHEIAGEENTVSSYSPPSAVTQTGNADLNGGNLLARWRRVQSDRSDFQVQAYFDRTSHFEPDYGETRNTVDIDALDHLKLHGGQDLLWGLGARVSPGDFVQRVPILDFLPRHLTDQIYSGFVQDAIPLLHDQLSLTVGSKVEHNNYTGFEFQPSARLLWNQNPHQTFWASISRAVRTPSRLDTQIQLTGYEGTTTLPIFLRIYGNRQFHSEELIAYEAGFRTLVTSSWYVDVALFYNQYHDLYSFQLGVPFLETTPSPAHAILPVLTSNGIHGDAGGFELAPDWKPVSWWELRASYAYLNMDLKNEPWSNDPSSAAQDEGSTPRNQLVTESLVNLNKHLEFDQTFRYVEALPAQMVRSYETADARFGWHATQQLQLFVTGQNLLQPHFAQFGGDPSGLVQVRRGVYAKLVWRLGD
ncbi:MAG TPA: TonB-dependent receptor [Acidobacteriaceae bacterium]|nr:TonB-dependent receptor [Acidobacteriaceae bacterium]